MCSTPFEEIAATYQDFTFTMEQIHGTGSVEVFQDETASSASQSSYLSAFGSHPKMSQPVTRSLGEKNPRA